MYVCSKSQFISVINDKIMITFVYYRLPYKSNKHTVTQSKR